MEWISVNERLPEREQRVLVSNSVTKHVTIGEMADEYNYGHWFWGRMFDTDLGSGVFTHWMPLPEPPKEKK